MHLPKYVTKILLIISLWLCFTVVYSLQVWLFVDIVITLISRQRYCMGIRYVVL